ncbi:MAG: AraC family transcriptional regulator [Candidatus Melainabacteria bacterium]|nr:AraC family transcriptional regulator [Candidatus Melainabacteria bacterium]
MSSNPTYTQILENAVEYIEANIFQPLSTAMIAGQVGFSEYHFQRIFSTTLGESPADYVRKRRLSEAANKLKESRATISDITNQFQFGSQEAFTRSFKQLFGQTPGQYRNRSESQELPLVSRADLSRILDIRQGRAITPVVVERNFEEAVGLAGSFSPKSLFKINALWNRFVERRHEITNVKSGYLLGVCSLSHPLIAKAEGHTFVYVAAAPVHMVSAIPKDMVPCQLTAGRYALFTYKGKLCDFQHAVDFIWKTWVPAREYELRDAPDFEIYDHRFSETDLEGEVDIYMPIV